MGNDFKDLFGDWDPGGEIPPPGNDKYAGEPENRAPRPLNEKEVKVVGVYEHADPNGIDSRQTFVVLLQDNQGRKVPIWIGKFEALAISLALEGGETDRPVTHDLVKIVIDRLGATVERVIIDDLWDDTFYAKLIINHNGETQDIDCRPSDAVAVALRTHSPIYMAELVIESIQKFRADM